MKSATNRLLDAIGYPERVRDGVAAFTLQVDGGEIDALEANGALRLVCRLTDEPERLPALAEYAAGRLLREDAALAFGSPGDRAQDCAFLWQEVSAAADAHDLRRFFESFCDSCDWWRARLQESVGAEAEPALHEMRILP